MGQSVITTSPAVFLEGAVNVRVSISTTSLEAGDNILLYADGVSQGAMTEDGTSGLDTLFNADYAIGGPDTTVSLEVRLQRGTLIGMASTPFEVSYRTLPIPTITGVNGITS